MNKIENNCKKHTKHCKTNRKFHRKTDQSKVLDDPHIIFCLAGSLLRSNRSSVITAYLINLLRK